MFLDIVEVGNYEKVIDLLDSDKSLYPIDINFKGLDEWTALHFACNEGHLNLVRLLIKKGAQLESETSMKRRPIHLASLRGNHEIVKVLIENKVDVNSQDSDFYTALHYACEIGLKEIVIMLLQ